MHYLFLVARIYPFVTIALSVPTIQLGIYYRHKKHALQWSCWGLLIAFVVTTALWFVFRGDRYSDGWIQNWFY